MTTKDPGPEPNKKGEFFSFSAKNYTTGARIPKMKPAPGITLNEADPFEKAMSDIVRMFRRKNADYARPDQRWSNFEDMARTVGMGSRPWMSAVMLCQQKLSRIGGLAASDKDPINESVLDTLLDNSVYAAIAYAMALEGK